MQSEVPSDKASLSEVSLTNIHNAPENASGSEGGSKHQMIACDPVQNKIDQNLQVQKVRNQIGGKNPPENNKGKGIKVYQNFSKKVKGVPKAESSSKAVQLVVSSINKGILLSEENWSLQTSVSGILPTSNQYR